MKTRIWTALLAIYLAWGSTYLAIHYAVQSIPPFLMTGVRFLVAGMVLYAWRRLAGDPAPSRMQWRSAAIAGNLLLVGGIGGVAWAEQFVPSGISALVVAATPLWIVLLEALRKGGKRPASLTVAGVLVGLVGIFILVDSGRSSAVAGSRSWLGMAVLLLASLSWSIGSLYSHGADLPKSALMGTGIELLAGSAGSFVLGLATGEAGRINLGTISPASLGGLAYLIVVGSIIGFACYTWLLRVAPTTLVVTYAYVNPLIAVMLGSLLAGELLTPREAIAIPLIIAAIVLIEMKKPEKAAIDRPMITLPSTGGED